MAETGKQDYLLSIIGTIVVAAVVPWEFVLSDTALTGGDVPAHPVLMKSLADAFFNHRDIIHYSYHFWMGFELFQFYFALPYLSGAILSAVLPFNMSFKLMSIFGVVALPPAFYFMARYFGTSRIVACAASILSVSFLFTDAHTMWGGNVQSALSGMIANAWAFVFIPLAFGKILTSRRDYSFSLSAVIWSTLVMHCHFYGLPNAVYALPCTLY